ncbi:MAG: glycosyltransferase family 2 protein [Gloeobacteraceae cyanobacterium ES-bin-316]|nr:glycosyltransferase family 2 protein [Ferruginibacter sp.]
MQLSVIIVNYNVKYFLEQCLYSVLKACSTLKSEIFVVDNCSTDGSKEYLSQKFPQVTFKWNNTNDGFGKANNSVLKEAKGNHILFLNPDTLVAEDCFTKCLSFFAKQPNCGALGVHMIDGAGRFLKESKRGFPSPLTSFFKMSGLARLFSSSKIFASYYAGHLPEKENSEAEVLSGAFMMLSKKAVEITGGFDEDFFMYGEDVDLSFRIRQAGMANYYFADTSIIHFKGESTQRLSEDYIEHFYGAMLLFVKKHYSAKKKTVFLMERAIRISKGIAFLKVKKSKKAANKTKVSLALNTAVMASQPVFNDCIHLIKHASPPVLLAGRISLESGDTAVAIGSRSHLKESLRQNKIEQLIFCEGEISFAEIIGETRKLAGKTNLLFHAAGSNSIVGSNNKNGNGIFIAKP